MVDFKGFKETPPIDEYFSTITRFIRDDAMHYFCNLESPLNFACPEIFCQRTFVAPMVDISPGRQHSASSYKKIFFNVMLFVEAIM